MKRLAAILLAAGASRRFVGNDKLIAPLVGRPLADWLFHTVESLDLKQAIVVMRPDASDELCELARRRGLDIVVNERANEGVGASLAAGAAALKRVEGVFVCPTDMPLAPATVFRACAKTFFADEKADVVAPTYQGRRGHPVLFGKRYFPVLCAQSGDIGARAIVMHAETSLACVETDDDGVLFDVDSQGDLFEAEKKLFLRERAHTGFRPPAT